MFILIPKHDDSLWLRRVKLLLLIPIQLLLWPVFVIMEGVRICGSPLSDIRAAWSNKN